MGKLYEFVGARRARFPMPLCARSGDKFLRVNICDDSHGGIESGSFVIVALNRIKRTGLHALRGEAGIIFARITFVSRRRVNVLSLHETLQSKQYDISELSIVGHVTDIYPKGDINLRLVCCDEKSARRPKSAAHDEAANSRTS
jgi:hypothetical protein